MNPTPNAAVRPHKPRNHYVDFVRGLAALSVIFIHTVWWSGAVYVPEPVRQASLLFEVPLFFFLAGWTYAFSKNMQRFFKGLLRLQVQYTIFIALFAVLLLLMGSQSVTGHNVFAWLVHYYIPTDTLPIVIGSFWFLGVYICVSIGGALLAKYLTSRQLWLALVPLVGLTLYFQQFPFSIESGIFHIVKPDYIAFYLFFYLLGYLLKDVYVQKLRIVAAIAVANTVALAGVAVASGLDIFNIQELKFPPTFVYLLWSLYGILLVVALKKRFETMPATFVSYLGANAIFLFFGQGIASSLIYYYMDAIALPYWWLKLAVILSINIIMTCMFAAAIRYILTRGEAWVMTVLRFAKNKMQRANQAA